MPHMRRGRDRDAEGLRGRFAARCGAQRRDVVAGDRLGGRRDQRLHFLVLVRRDACRRSWARNSTFQPLGAGARQLDLLGRRGAGIGEHDRDRGLDAGRGARAEQAFAAGDVDLGLAGDVEPRSVVTDGVLGRRLCAVDLVLAGGDRVRRLDLELDVLRLAGIERKRIELLAAVLLGEGRVEILRRRARPGSTVTFLPLSFLMPSWNSKFDFELPRNSGSCGLSVSLAGKSLASVTATGRRCVRWSRLAR